MRHAQPAFKLDTTSHGASVSPQLFPLTQNHPSCHPAKPQAAPAALEHYVEQARRVRLRSRRRHQFREALAWSLLLAAGLMTSHLAITNHETINQLTKDCKK